MKLRHMGTNSTKILTTLFANEITMTTPVADPGFSPGGCANSQNCYYFSNFCRKLHENERIWTPRGGGRDPGAALGSANAHSTQRYDPNAYRTRHIGLLGKDQDSDIWQMSRFVHRMRHSDRILVLQHTCCNL